MSTPFIIRVRTSKGTSRLLFPTADATWSDLQVQLGLVTGITQAQYSTSPLSRPTFINFADTTTLRAAGLKHGDMLFVKPLASRAPAIDPSTSTSTSSTAAAVTVAHTHKLSELCQHGPRSTCVHCVGAPDPAAKVTAASCQHPPSVVCPKCMPKAEADAPVIPHCNHPSGAFCPECMPPAIDDPDAPSAHKCSCTKGQQCIHCANTKPAIKVNFVPYQFMMDERKALCRFSHASNQTCGSCAEPVLPSYQGKKDCTRGHHPWPNGVCLNCAPPNVVFRLQKYRHCDAISFQDPQALQQFYRQWMQTGGFRPRAALLFGQHIQEPHTTNNMGAVRANVYALYVPPQETTRHGVRFLRDPKEAGVMAVAVAMGLTPVGWVVTTQPREGDKYGGKVFMSGTEIRQAAMFQNRFKDSKGHSKFVTVVMEHGAQVEPLAYQVSDQCVALERDNVLAPASDPNLLATRKPKGKELLPTVIYKDQRLAPGTDFVADELIVKVIVMVPPNPRPLFAHNTFPSDGTRHQMMEHMKQYAHEPLVKRLSDFNLLCGLSQVFDSGLLASTCKAINSGSISQDLQNSITTALAGAGIL